MFITLHLLHELLINYLFFYINIILYLFIVSFHALIKFLSFRIIIIILMLRSLRFVIYLSQ